MTAPKRPRGRPAVGDQALTSLTVRLGPADRERLTRLCSELGGVTASEAVRYAVEALAGADLTAGETAQARAR